MAKKVIETDTGKVKLTLKKDLLAKISRFDPENFEEKLQRGLPTGFCPEKGLGGGLGRPRKRG